MSRLRWSLAFQSWMVIHLFANVNRKMQPEVNVVRGGQPAFPAPPSGARGVPGRQSREAAEGPHGLRKEKLPRRRIRGEIVCDFRYNAGFPCHFRPERV